MEKPREAKISKIPVRGVTGLIIVLAVCTLILIEVPATRWFLLLSVVTGGIIGGGLYLWNNRGRQ